MATLTKLPVKTYTIKEGPVSTIVSSTGKEKAMADYFGVLRACKSMTGPNEYSNMRFSKNRRAIYRRATIECLPS